MKMLVWNFFSIYVMAKITNVQSAIRQVFIEYQDASVMLVHGVVINYILYLELSFIKALLT